MGVDILFNVPKHPNAILYSYQCVNVPVRIMYLGTGKLVKVECEWMQHFAKHLQQGWKLIDIFWDQSKKSHGGNLKFSVCLNPFPPRPTKTDPFIIYSACLTPVNCTCQAGFKLSFANSPNTSSKLNLAKTFQYKFAKKLIQRPSAWHCL